MTTTTPPAALGSMHPLEPLSVEEMTEACRVVAGRWPDPEASKELRYPVVALAEPDRAALRSWRPGDPITRRADVVVLDRTNGLVSEAVVDLSQGAIERWRDLPGFKPALLFDESLAAICAVQEDPAWLAALARRGITDLTNIQIDPWPAGNFDLPGEAGRRLFRCVSYVRHEHRDNGYAHPIEGVVAVYDSGAGEVIEVIDTGVVPVPAECANYTIDKIGPVRTGLRPLEVSQPEGVSFEVQGHEIRWQRWSLRFTIHPIEGLVLHTVGYEDEGRLRPILHRASIAEMVVPYGAPGVCHWWKNAFDAGEWGLGRMIQPLTLGCDCLGEIRYFDAVLPDDMGGARTIDNAVCLHEEDYSILWKHVDLWSGASEVRRSRRLVLSSIATVGNYEYGFYWYFYLDGTIQLEVKLTGIMQTGALDEADAGQMTEATTYGARLAPGLWAPNHQHLFCARLDMEVDGPGNSVYEVDALPAPEGPDNPYGNGMITRATLLASEAQAQRMADPSAARRWKIVNPSVRNSLGEPVGYTLFPVATPVMMAAPTSSVSRRATFATRNLWVTPDDPDQRRPAGAHPNQSGGGDGLPAWTSADRPVVETDLVVWHSFGVTHLPRPEDWPVMPVEYTGFSLKPVGFFARNPALDLPPSAGGHACAPDSSAGTGS